MRGGQDDGHVSPQLLLLLHPPLRLIMQPFSLQIALVAKCLAYELMKKVTLLAGDWPVDTAQNGQLEASICPWL